VYRLNWKFKIVFFLLLFTLYMADCKFACRTMTPDDPNGPTAVNVDFKYLRDVTLPKTFPNNDLSVWLQMQPNQPTPPDNQMEKIADETFFKQLVNVPINYPGKPGEYYKIFLVDGVFSSGDPLHDEVSYRAHAIWLNGYLMDKVHQNSDGSECLYVKFDKDGVPHQY